MAFANYSRSFLTGSAFAVSWTPCIGPVLGAILTLAASSSTLVSGAGLLLAWSLGLGVPFILSGLLSSSILGLARRAGRLSAGLEFTGGMILIVVGLLVFIGQFTMVNRFFTLGLSAILSSETGLAGLGMNGATGFLVAFLAGCTAFLSPCCLPLVPSYLAHLAGVVADREEMASRRTETFRHSLVFVAGFTLIFVVLGASVGAVGYLLKDAMPILQKVAGAFLVLMGLNLTGAVRVPFLSRTYEVASPALSARGG